MRSSGSRIVHPPQSEYTPKNILITGGAGFMYAFSSFSFVVITFSLYSASHVVIHFVKKYPQYKIVNLDKLDYCSSLANLKEIENAPNYKFVKVCNYSDVFRFIY